METDQRRCSVASKSDGYYYEIDDKTNSCEQLKTPSIKKLIQESLTRKSSRRVTPNKKFIEGFKTEEKSKVKYPNEIKKKLNDSSSYQSIKASDMLDNKTRFENLFENSIDVEGAKMYGFNTPKKKNGMTIKALCTSKTSTLNVPKTPRNVRLKTKAEISKLLMEASESDFSADESDYDPNESSQNEFSENISSEEGTLEEENEIRARSQKMSFPCAPSMRKRAEVKIVSEYIPLSDGYFKSYANKKNVTSDHTLNRLKNPRLPHSKLFSLLALMKLPNEHERCLTALLKEYKMYFGKWIQLFDEGYNVLLCGLGSKRRLLQTFHSEILPSQPVIVVNGFFPSLTIKDILDAINQEMLQINASNGSMHEVVDIIEMELAKLPKNHLFLIIHNIDGPMFRNQKAQEILGRLASIPNIHLMASTDHINTPLLWDHMELNNYNFSWWDVTTMLPYSDETSFENFMLVQNSPELALSSMNNVFQSLTTNARKIYMLIAEQQLSNQRDTNYQGVPFRDLYWLSREAFLVSSDLALRAQLIEFLDHKLVKSRRTADGTEHLRIPIGNKMLEQFTEQYKL